MIARTITLSVTPRYCGAPVRPRWATPICGELRNYGTAVCWRCARDNASLGERIAAALDGEQGGMWYDYLAVNLAFAAICNVARERAPITVRP